MMLSLLKNIFPKKALFIFIITLMSIPAAFSIDLATAKQQGLVGERNDGYLGYVVKPASSEVKALVKNVNSKRKSFFIKTAKKSNISTAQVANRFYERAVGATKSGRYYQAQSGQWVKK